MAYEVGDPIGTAAAMNEYNSTNESKVGSSSFSNKALNTSTEYDSGEFSLQSNRSSTYPDLDNIRLRYTGYNGLGYIRMYNSSDVLVLSITYSESGNVGNFQVTAYEDAIFSSGTSDSNQELEINVYFAPGTYTWSQQHKRDLYLLDRSTTKLGIYALQGQTDIVSGDIVRVWLSDFSELATANGNILTAELANASRCGYDEDEREETTTTSGGFFSTLLSNIASTFLGGSSD